MLVEKFLEKVHKTDDCWYWTGRMSPNGYGNWRVAGKSIGAHRLAYELFVGEIPPKRVIDHSCHNKDLTCKGGWSCLHRRCVNPGHLNAVTQAENLMTSTLTTMGQQTCRNGLHDYTFDNIFTEKSGVRRCKACLKAKQKKRWQNILKARG